MKLHHRSNGNCLCACEVRAIQHRQYRNHREGFCGTGDVVLFSYQTVSHACSLIRSAAFVWSRPEWWLVYAATQSYRICRQKCIFHDAAGGSLFLAISNSFYFTGLEMSRSMYGNCYQAGAALCLFLLVDKWCIKLLWWARGGSSQLNPEWQLWVSWKRIDFDHVVCMRHPLCQPDGKWKTSTIRSSQMCPLLFLT